MMMKFGTQTGSLVNHIQTNMTNRTKPEVGMGVTFYSWSDRNPGTIVEVWNDDQNRQWIAVTGDSYKRIDNNGMSESQEYEYTSNMESENRSTFRFDEKNQRWQNYRKNPETGRWIKGSQNINIGRREKYHDFSF